MALNEDIKKQNCNEVNVSDVKKAYEKFLEILLPRMWLTGHGWLKVWKML